MQQSRHPRKLLVASLVILMTAGGGLPQASFGETPEKSAAPAGLASLLKDVASLVKEYYPKAKIAVTESTLHFEDKIRNEAGIDARKLSAVPQNGGILGDLTLTPGKYKGEDKDRLPSEGTYGFDRVLVMAPYSLKSDSHLLSRLIFPSDTSLEFKQSFKDIIKTFNAGEPVATTDTTTESKAPQVAQANQPESKSPSNVIVGETHANTPAESAAPENAAKTGEVSVSTEAAKPAAKAAPTPVFAGTRMTKYAYPEGRFRVMLPGNPKMNYKMQAGLRMVDYEYPDVQGSYDVSYLIMPGQANPAMTNTLLEKIAAGIVLSMKAEKVKQTATNYQGYPAVQLQIGGIKDKPGLTGLMILCSVRRYVYVVAAIGKKEWLSCPSVAEFWSSFSFTPEMTAQEQAQEQQRQAQLKQQAWTDNFNKERSSFDQRFHDTQTSNRKAFEKSQMDFKYRRN